jgi:RNA polymerase sigma-70 factor (ECF subfamily)
MGDSMQERWLPAAVRGDPEAVEALVRHLMPAVYRYCRARLPDREAAEDVTQEVIIALIRALRGHQVKEERLGAYVFGIATNRVAMYYRAARRRRELLTDQPPDGQVRATGPEGLAEEKENRELMRSAVAQLNNVQQQVVLLRIAAGLSAAETGRVLGLSAGAVRVAQYRALRRLREIMDPEVLR